VPWNKGLKKFDHQSVLKISQTMRERKIDNFKAWRESQKQKGLSVNYSILAPSLELAEYIGVILGDGNISRFDRTDRILIVGDYNKISFINRYAKMTELLFLKRPTISRVKGTNTVRISLYQKNIADRLGVPTGNRSKLIFHLPAWIDKDITFLVAFLKGLYEAEGSLSIHLPTYTYNFQFSNKNTSLLLIVEKALKLLGYHPEVRINAIRLRRKLEVESFKQLITYRSY
jgi:hypothetical protein